MSATSRLSARAQVQAVLRQRIISSDLAPGAAISEKEIAAELGVSRTPVREGLILLSEEGLVQVYPQLGTFVTPISLEQVQHSQFVRESIEAASLKQAFDKVSEADSQELSVILALQARAVRAINYDSFFELDDAFHRRLMAVSGHESAWKEVSAAKVHMDRVRRLSLPLPNVLERLLREHEAIAAALTARDSDAGLESLHTHLSGVFADIESIRAQQPEKFTASANGRPVRTVMTALRPQ